LAISLLIGCSRGEAPPPDRGPVTPLDPAQTGTVTGTVRVDGPVPPGTVLHLAGDPACTALGYSEITAGDVLVSDGRVQNAFVYVARGLEGRLFERPKEVVRIDQRGCVFMPRIVAAESGQAIEFVNSDPTLHNVHIVAERSKGMNFGLAVAGASRSVHLDVAEVMVGCAATCIRGCAPGSRFSITRSSHGPPPTAASVSPESRPASTRSRYGTSGSGGRRSARPYAPDKRPSYRSATRLEALDRRGVIVEVVNPDKADQHDQRQ
jgi:plastocyanin